MSQNQKWDQRSLIGLSRRFSIAVLTIAATLALSIPGTRLHAQVGSADVLGTVTDPSGAVVLGAKVTVKNLGTAIERTTTTNAKGEYVVNLLPIGSYGLTVESPGFKTYRINGFSLSTGDRARIDAKLDTGAVTEKVEVTADAATLQTDSSTVSSTIDTTSVQDLPLLNRNYFSVVETTAGINVGNPGGSTTFESATSGKTSADRRPASTVVANGQNDSLNNNMVNGFDNNELLFGIAGARPTTDGIAEVNVESTNAPAEYGRAAGAVVNVVTKSGTNSFHGSAFEYLKNEFFDARDYINTVGNPQARDRQNNFGGSLGGPVWIPRLYNGKDKTFFFFGYEKDPNAKGTSYITRVPTKYEVDNPGDFTDIGGSVLPAADTNALSLKMFELYPEPNYSVCQAQIGCYASSPSLTQQLMDMEGRVDQHFSAKDILFARYAYNPANTFAPGSLPMKNGAWAVGNAGFASPGTSITNTQSAQLDYAHIFKPSLLLDLKAGYALYNSHAQGINFGKGLAAQFGVPFAMGKGTVGDDLPMYGGPAFVWDGIGGGSTYHDLSNSYQYIGSLIYSRGSHDLKFGGGLIARQLSYAGNADAVGRIITGVPLPPYFDQRLDFLAGYPIFLFRNSAVYNTYYRNKEWSAYAQDNWRVTPKLTLNLGLRYDSFDALHEKFNHDSNFNASTLGDEKPLDAHNFYVGGNAGVNTDLGNIVPRIGFAYSLNTKTVVRGGIGMSYSPTNGGVTSATNAPFNFNYAAFMPNLNDVDPATTPWKNPTVTSLADWNTDSSVTSLANVPANPKSIRVYQSNLALQREFGANTITVAYVGVFGRDLATTIDLNKPVMPGAGNPTAPYVYTIPSSGPPGGGPGGPPPPAIKALAAKAMAMGVSPYAILNNVTSISSSTYHGYSTYNAMQLIYARHIGKDLTLNSNWTWAHNLATINGMGQNSNGAGAPNDDQLEYGNSTNDIRHRITATVSYTLPFGKSSHGLTGMTIKGWQANAVYQWQTGTPFTIISGVTCDVTVDPRCVNANGQSYTNQQGQTYYAPDIVGKPFLTRNFSASNPFNYNAFAPPVPGTDGNEGVNPLYGPHYRDADLSIHKIFQITEGVGVQFRAECFNFTNTPNFVTPMASISSWVPSTVTSQNPSGLVAGGISYNQGLAGFSVSRAFQFALKVIF